MNAPTPLESSGIVPPAPHVTLPRFGLLLVGDELLSGRRADQHVPKTIELLAARGLTLSYVHMVGDARADISAQLAPILKSGDVVFSCGGIGATPDDQTRQAAAEAAGVPLALHPQAEALIGQRFAELAAQKGIPFEPDSADHQQRLQMGVFPQGAQIVPNPYNRIPGFSLGHVHFFPGFPAMAWPMMEWTLDTYYSFWFDQRAWAENAVVVKSASEAMLTPMMEALEARYAGIKVFSLPTLQHPEQGPHIDLGVKGDPVQVERAFGEMLDSLRAMGCDLGPVQHPVAR